MLPPRCILSIGTKQLELTNLVRLKKDLSCAVRKILWFVRSSLCFFFMTTVKFILFLMTLLMTEKPCKHESHTLIIINCTLSHFTLFTTNILILFRNYSFGLQKPKASWKTHKTNLNISSDYHGSSTQTGTFVSQNEAKYIIYVVNKSIGCRNEEIFNPWVYNRINSGLKIHWKFYTKRRKIKTHETKKTKLSVEFENLKPELISTQTVFHFRMSLSSSWWST